MSSQTIEHLYQVRVYNSGGTLDAIYDNLVSCMYTKYTNKPGLAVLTVQADHDLLNYQDQNRYFEIWISYPTRVTAALGFNQTWKLDYAGLYRDTQFVTDHDGVVYAQIYIPSLMSLLDRYVIAYTAGVNDKTNWIGQELAIIVNDVVQWNVTEEALIANDRLRDATQIRGLTDDGAIVSTAIVNYSVAPGRSVLEFMQELAPVLGFDFDVFYNSGGDNAFHIHQYDGQLGSDLSASVIFDLALDNTSKANYTGDKLREKTVAIVGGPGDGATRTFAIRYGANYTADNEYEIYVDARSNDATELDDIGDAALAKYQARAQVQGQIRDSYGWQYGRDYNLGDLVSISFAGIIATKKISRVEVVFDQTQKNQINLDFDDIII